MDKQNELRLRRIANSIRREIVDEVHAAGCGHPGGSLSIADILAYLYFEKMNIHPKNPKLPGRDRFVLSKGHTAPGLYAALAERGFFPREDLITLRKTNSYLQGHPDMKSVPGVDMSTGSLGLGISAACGMALSGKVSGDGYRVYTIIGDGESEEGQVWEAAMAANKFHLDNLCAVIDLNGLQIDGTTEEVMPTEPVDQKFESFGWHVIKIDGHDFDQIDQAFEEAKATKGQPTVILAATVKGKGVSFMENNAGWHGKAPNAEQYEQAKAELEARIAELEVQ